MFSDTSDTLIVIVMGAFPVILLLVVTEYFIEDAPFLPFHTINFALSKVLLMYNEKPMPACVVHNLWNFLLFLVYFKIRWLSVIGLGPEKKEICR
jgi:hypothetical protein